MIQLFNGCKRSNLTITPKNWNTQKASVKKPWRIFYRFYDPNHRDRYKKGKPVPIKGMNYFKTLAERQEETRQLLDNELEMLDKKGYNPITGQFMAQVEAKPAATDISIITPETKFIDALRMALKLLKVVDNTYSDIKSVITGTEKAAKHLFDSKLQKGFIDLDISEVSLRHIKYILTWCEANNPRFSNRRFNSYKAYLSMLFVEIKETESIEMNPTRDIKCRKKTRKIKETLTLKEQGIVSTLRETNYSFWRYIMVFFRSGTRSTELFFLRKNDVNLQKQEFKVTVKKGRNTREDTRVITDDVLYLWQEIVNEAKDGQFLFCKGLLPGDRKIRPDLVCRRWDRHVKKKHGITKDFYSLKHLNEDEVAKLLDIRHAQAMAGHTNEETTRIYTVGENQRRLDRLKRTTVKFGKAATA